MSETAAARLQLRVCVLWVFAYADVPEDEFFHKHLFTQRLPLPVFAEFVDGLDPGVSLTLECTRGQSFLWYGNLKPVIHPENLTPLKAELTLRYLIISVKNK